MLEWWAGFNVVAIASGSAQQLKNEYYEPVLSLLPPQI